MDQDEKLRINLILDISFLSKCLKRGVYLVILYLGKVSKANRERERVS